MTLISTSPRYAPRDRPCPTTWPESTTVTAPDKPRLLEGVATAAAAFDAARDALHQAVRAALDNGASWSEIGGVLGVSRQAAFQRFGPKRGGREAGMIDP